MKFTTRNVTSFEEWKYNLLLMAPTKGEAKKTVSRGFIRVDMTHHKRISDDFWTVNGYATDDILSISAEFFGTLVSDREPGPFWVKPDRLKLVEPELISDGSYIIDIPEDEEFDLKFDHLFWADHVHNSIFEPAGAHRVSWVLLSPDRLRKFSLLKPTGSPLDLEFVNWDGRDIIRWSYPEGEAQGVYVPLEVGV